MTELEESLVGELRKQLTDAWADVNRLKVQLEAAAGMISMAVDLIPDEYRPAYRLAAVTIVEQLAAHRAHDGAGQGEG